MNNNEEYFLKGFLSFGELRNLLEYEQYLYCKCLEVEKYKLQSDVEFQVKRREIEMLLPSSNWGLFIFKPPRASSYLKTELREKFLVLLKQKKFLCLGSYEVNMLTEGHIRAMYPGDVIMPYWHDLKQKMLNLPAIYFLIISPNQENIWFDIEMIKGWYKVDKTRGHLTPKEGLRAVFRRAVEEKEGYFEEITPGSEKYEDSGIHAPCSLTSRFLQLLGFMAIDADGSKWARSCLPWLQK